MVDLIDDPQVLQNLSLQSNEGEASVPVATDTLKPFSKNLETLAKGLQFGGVPDLKDWLESKLFSGFWQEYKDQCLETRHKAAAAKGVQVATGESLRDVREAIEIGERYGLQKYSAHFVNKDSWDSIDHEAFFFYHCTKTNVENRDGALYDKNFSEDAAYHAIWQVKIYMTQKNTAE